MMKRFKGTKGVILLLIMVMLVVGYYFYLSNRTTPDKTEEMEVETMTRSQTVLSRNLENNYPKSPREVVKYFSEITSCFYNEEHTQEELKALGDKAREVYDDELIANQTEDEYLKALQMDIDEYKANNRTISSYSPSSSVDVFYFSQDGSDWARLYCVYDIKQDAMLYQSTLCFVLRKDENGHYKIFGWETSNDNEESDKAQQSEEE